MTSLDRIRTDVVGSLLSPQRWKEARLRFDSQVLKEQEFQEIELECVKTNLALQEAIGLDVVTDGEVGRLNFQDSFGLSVSGYAAARETVRTQERRAAGGAPLSRWEIPDLAAPGTPVVHRRPVTEKLQLKTNIPLAEYRRAASHAKKPLKVTLIGPDRIAQRFDHAGSKAVYRDTDAFMADVVKLERQMIGELAAAGCRYVHIDEPGYTAYVDEPSLKAMRDRGEDPQENLERSLRANAAIVAGFDGVTFGIHLCRGNQRSMWHREGAYDAIAERLFNEIDVTGYFLEYDSPRAGGFAPLRFARKDAVVVLGLVSTKVSQLESVDELARKIEEAAKYVPLERLAISPQCGFGSDAVGNLVSEDDQKRKLERVVEVARKVWR